VYQQRGRRFADRIVVFDWMSRIAVISPVVSILSALVVVALLNGHAQKMPVMNAVWAGPLALLVYWRTAGRAMIPESAA
jgi:hypothetical protein